MSYQVLQSLDDLENIGDAYTANMTPNNEVIIRIASKLIRVSADSVVVSTRTETVTIIAQVYENCSTQSDTTTQHACVH